MKSIGPYRIVRRLGAGGMAQVFEAVRTGASGFEKRVAIKILRDEREGEANATRLLIEEAKLGARVGHQNLVKIDELDVDQGRYYVVMELVEGRDLASLLATKDDRMPAPLAVKIVQEIAWGLGALHRATDGAGRPLGLVHRDVNPQNVLVSWQGEVKLADFGITKATLETDQTQQVRLKGKVAYMSPEQAEGERLTPASDVFSLGVSFIELLTGERPFDGPNVIDTLARVKAAEPVHLDGVDADVAAVALRAIARAPEDRFADGAALHEALGPLAASGPQTLAVWAIDRRGLG